MNGFDSQRQESMKRRWQEGERAGVLSATEDNHNRSTTFSGVLHSRILGVTSTVPLVAKSNNNSNNNNNNLQSFPGWFDDDLVSTVVPPVTVVFEGRSICHRISLQNHASYQSLAKALRHMFVDGGDGTSSISDDDLDLSNAVPGHLIAYEDMEDDLLLVGDLKWKDFVRVAKRIRILPAKSTSRKGRGAAA